MELSAEEKKRKRLEAARRLLGSQAASNPGGVSLTPAPAPASTSSAVSAFFSAGEDEEETERAEAVKEERRRRLQAMKLDIERDKAALAPNATHVRSMLGSSYSTARAVAPQAQEEEDPLDAFMRTNVVAQAEADAAKAAAHAVAWQAQYGHKSVDVDVDKVDEEKDMNLHCYVCKQWGHTKKDCPQKRCKFCNKAGHVAGDCPEKDQKIERQFENDKQRKRAKQYAAKKAKRAKEWESQLRSKTGVEGFQVLYEILGLPPRKLATKEQIRRAYRLQSLRYHPDKVMPDEAEGAAEKFLAIKTAYDLLLEGIETGGVGMAGAVFSGGDLEYAGWDASSSVSRVGNTNRDPSSGTRNAKDEVAGFGSTSTKAVEEEMDEMDGAAQIEALQAMAAACARARDGDGSDSNDDDRDDDTVARGDDESRSAQPVVWLRDSELRALLSDRNIRSALEEVALRPSALDLYSKDAVFLGLLHSLRATHADR